jgi:hypothetical protein
VLVWNNDPPKKITPAASTTDAIRIMRVVITLPRPFLFLNCTAIVGIIGDVNMSWLSD